MENKVEMELFFEYEYDAKMDGLHGKFTGFEIVHIHDYEEVDNMIKTAVKAMKKRNATITFRCVKFKPYYDSRAMYKLTNEFSARCLKWEEWEAVADEYPIELNAKEIKQIAIDAIHEYERREMEEENKSKESEYCYIA